MTSTKCSFEKLYTLRSCLFTTITQLWCCLTETRRVTLKTTLKHKKTKSMIITVLILVLSTAIRTKVTTIQLISIRTSTAIFFYSTLFTHGGDIS